MKFPSHLNCDGKIVNEMGPWFIMPYIRVVTLLCASEKIGFSTKILSFYAQIDPQNTDMNWHWSGDTRIQSIFGDAIGLFV